MRASKQPRPLLLFYILVMYVFLQFGWWAWLLTHLNGEVTALLLEKQRLLGQPGSEAYAETVLQLEHQLLMKRLMILGEGAVFLTLLILGIVRTRNSFRKEAALVTRQKNFLLSVTHELKSPLASVKLQLETLRHRQLPAPQQQEIISDALEDTERLHALVDNILVAARIDNSSYQLHPEVGNLSTAVEELLGKAQSGHGRRHVFESDITPNMQVAYDQLALHSVVVNLIENAVNYSPKGSLVHVRLMGEGKRGLLQIADRGAGIPDAEKENVFRRFYRLGNEETRSTRGTGLGLYLVRHLTEAHGWSIRIIDHAGGGSIFEVSFPLNS